MQFSWDFLQNMLENGHSNLQTNLWVHITSNIFKISNSKITGSHQPPDLPTLKAYPTPGVGGRFGIWRENEGKGWTWRYPEQFYPLAVRFWAPVRKPLGGLVQPPLGELGLNKTDYFFVSYCFCNPSTGHIYGTEWPISLVCCKRLFCKWCLQSIIRNNKIEFDRL